MRQITPGNAPWVLTVGASTHQGTLNRTDDAVTGFSSSGPSAIDYEAKPDIVASGTGIVSLSDPGSLLYRTRSAFLVGGKIDTVLNRSQDVLFAFPTLLLAIIIVAVLGPGLFNAVLAIAIVYTPRFARIARASALSVKTSEYLEAARLAGVTTPAILVRHMLPNVMPSVIVLAALSMSTAQLAYASLSFLGLGVSPPQADWGSMLSKARDFITIAPWLTVWPIAALVALMLAFNVLGDAIRDVMDPRHSSGARPEAAL